MANRYSFFDFPPIIPAFLPVSRIMSQRPLPPTPPFPFSVTSNVSQFATHVLPQKGKIRLVIGAPGQHCNRPTVTSGSKAGPHPLRLFPMGGTAKRHTTIMEEK